MINFTNMEVFAFELSTVTCPLKKCRSKRKGQKHYSLNFCIEGVLSFWLQADIFYTLARKTMPLGELTTSMYEVITC